MILIVKKDPDTSSIVEKTIKLLKSYGFKKNNTIFILCSDHGYPDPSKGYNSRIIKEKKLTHDVFMTDDNIMIPLLISLPKYKVNRKYTNQISSLNIFPTILDYLNIDIPKTNLEYSESLLNYLEKDNNSKQVKKRSDIPARSDARFLGQSKRVCCVRNKNIKIIYSYDENKFSYNYYQWFKRKEIKLRKNKKIYKRKFKIFKKLFKKNRLSSLRNF